VFYQSIFHFFKEAKKTKQYVPTTAAGLDSRDMDEAGAHWS
jgi:hypothetical protein